jgi:iron complex transport system substrate-binding protein
MMKSNQVIAIIQVVVLLACSFGIYTYANTERATSENGTIVVVDSNGVSYSFDEAPTRVAMTNTYAGVVMKMLDVDLSVVVGVSGDFSESDLWPEFESTPLVQNSAHSEIDFEALLDTRPEIYIVFATNGMVDTESIRYKLEPVGIHVLALDFYKYDSLRDEINVLATLFDKHEEASELFSEFEAIESMVEQRIGAVNQSQRPNVVMEHHASLTRDPVVLTGTSQWTDLIEKAGGKNVFSELPGHTTHVDMEAILSANPDVLMFDGITFDLGYDAYDEDSMCEKHMTLISERPGFDEMAAVENDRLLIMSGEFAGPMMVFGLPTLAKQFHPDVFVDVDVDAYIDDFFSEYFDVQRKGKFTCVS